MSQAEQDRRIDYVEFGATDIDMTKRFYASVFGWEFEDYGPDYTAFRDGRLSGGFAKVEHVTGGGPLVVIYGSDLEAMLASVKTAGGAITKEIFSFPGGRRFHFSDPNGNELAVWSDQ
jgi:predicted enzyme related to lactoylglutathione lyase